MTKILINRRHGGFTLTHKVLDIYNSRTGRNIEYSWDLKRDDPVLIEIVEELGLEACQGWASRLKIVDVPPDVDWYIEEYDGMEWVAEKHRTWE